MRRWEAERCRPQSGSVHTGVPACATTWFRRPGSNSRWDRRRYPGRWDSPSSPAWASHDPGPCCRHRGTAGARVEEAQPALDALDERQLTPELDVLDAVEAPAPLSRHLGDVARRVLERTDPARRANLVNALVEVLGPDAGRGLDERVADLAEPLLRAVQLVIEGPGRRRMPAPALGVGQSDLLVNARGEPNLLQCMCSEIATADRSDVVVAFIKFSGLRPSEKRWRRRRPAAHVGAHLRAMRQGPVRFATWPPTSSTSPGRRPRMPTRPPPCTATTRSPRMRSTGSPQRSFWDQLATSTTTAKGQCRSGGAWTSHSPPTSSRPPASSAPDRRPAYVSSLREPRLAATG